MRQLVSYVAMAGLLALLCLLAALHGLGLVS